MPLLYLLMLLAIIMKAQPVKDVSLDDSGTIRISVGGEIRQRWEWFRNDGLGDLEPNSSGSLLQRYMLNADLRLRRQWRIFGELKSGIESGRPEGARPVDEDLLDVHQAWAEWSPRHVTIRAGRQEVNFGSGRLVSIREGPNVRLSFDGVRMTASTRAWNIQSFLLRPHQTNRGVLDDTPDFRQTLWGVYATRFCGGTAIDLYYLGLDRKDREFSAGRGRELRHSFGTRVAGTAHDWDFDYEAVWQTGQFADGRIRAWTTASNTGHTWEHVPLKPRLGMKANIASGDADPQDRTLGTFNALYPKGAYFSQADVLGPYNLRDLHPTASLELAQSLAVSGDIDLFWRHSTRDGIYDVPGFLILRGDATTARYVGYGLSLSTEWKLNRNVTLEVEYQRFIPGKLLHQAGRTRPVTYVGIWMAVRF